MFRRVDAPAMFEIRRDASFASTRARARRGARGRDGAALARAVGTAARDRAAVRGTTTR